jgi:hypothetical protein
MIGKETQTLISAIRQIIAIAGQSLKPPPKPQRTDIK